MKPATKAFPSRQTPGGAHEAGKKAGEMAANRLDENLHPTPIVPPPSLVTRAVTIFLVKLPETIQLAVRQAASETFPGAQFFVAPTVQEALQQPACLRQLLVLFAGDEAEIGVATQAMDGDELPRWAVVVLGRRSSELAEAVPLEECQPRILARIFRSAVLHHDLLRENLQLRGDLKTLAQRFRHDLVGPLHCIHLNCELINELLDEDPASVRAQLGAIRRCSTELEHLLERFNDVLRASMEPLPTALVSMQDVITHVLRQLDGKIQQNGAPIEQFLNWPEVNGVAQWLEMIWRNLILNALKHGQPKAPIQLGWTKSDEAWRFWITNRGRVPAEMETRLFLPFERLHTQTGVGLGLCVVHRLVSLQGGRCGYQRLDSDASEFYFTLPVLGLKA